MPKPRYKTTNCRKYNNSLVNQGSLTFWIDEEAITEWKQKYGYHRRSLSETAMYRVQHLLGASLTLRNYKAQVGETYAMIKALNKLTRLGMPETQYVV